MREFQTTTVSYHNRFSLLSHHAYLFCVGAVVVFERCLFLVAIDVAVLLAVGFVDFDFVGHGDAHLSGANCTVDFELVVFVEKMDDS